ncbi:MAG: 7-carboxy-7-deazaguanine synthase QueE [Chitinophagales bacterium]
MSTTTTQNIDASKALPVMEHFYTIQGEGAYQGQAAYFIRLAGCDVGCSWCDVKESWQADEHPIHTIDEIIDWIADCPTKIVVITGGEPLMYNLDTLTARIQALGKRTHIETSGAYPLSGKWDWICLSPKRFKKPLKECLQAAHELKTIIAHKNDFRFTEKHTEHISDNCLRFLQAEWSVREEVYPMIVNFVRENPTYQISVQTHKYIDVP